MNADTRQGQRAFCASDFRSAAAIISLTVQAPGFDSSARFTPNPAYSHRHTPAITPLKQITIRCVARWADRYEFWPVGYPHDAYKGPLETDPNKRDPQLAKLYARVRKWLERSHWAGYEFVGVLLYSGDRVILDMHDGDLGHLLLTQAQAEELAVCWQRFGLPSDLYIPAPPPTWE